MPTKMGNTHKSSDKIFGTMVFASLGEGMQGKTSVALGKVFRQVTARGDPDGGSNTSDHIAYRDSLLTRIFSPFLTPPKDTGTEEGRKLVVLGVVNSERRTSH